MAREVVIKSNGYELELFLDDRLPFPELLQNISEKFKESGKFFKNAKMSVSFMGRELTSKEELAIVDAIMTNSEIEIVSIVSRADEEEEEQERVTKKKSASASGTRKKSSDSGRKTKRETKNPVDPQAGFYKGILRSGQVLECPTSVTLVGDVNPGARIESAGSIVVLGALKGNACAGMGGDPNSFIFALDMKPIQLQIGNIIAKSPDKAKDSKHLFKREKSAQNQCNPQIAVAREGTILIRPMTKGCLDEI